MQTCGPIAFSGTSNEDRETRRGCESHLCMTHEMTCHCQSCTQALWQSGSIKGLLVCMCGRHSEGQTADSTAEALLFITGLLVEGRATADAAATLKVLGHLVQEPQPGSEDAFVAVLQTATLQGASLSVLATMVLRFLIQRQRPSFARLLRRQARKDINKRRLSLMFWQSSKC